jgi:hypothetical protein
MCDSLTTALNVRSFYSRHGVTNIRVLVADRKKRNFGDSAFSHFCAHDLEPREGGRSKSDDASLLEVIEPSLTPGGQAYVSRQYLKSENWITRITSGENYRIPTSFEKVADVEHYGGFNFPPYVKYFRQFSPAAFKFKLRGENTGTVYSKGRRAAHGRGRLIDQVRQGIESRIGRSLPISNLVRIGSGASLVVDFGSVIARIPQDREAATLCQRNNSSLKKMVEMDVTIPAPKAMCEVSIGGAPVFVESKIEGYSLDIRRDLADKFSGRVLLDAREWLVSEEFRVGRVDDALLDDLVRPPLQRLMDIIGVRYRDMAENFLVAAKACLLNDNIATVIEHGDFKDSNFLVAKATGRIIGMIDWDRSSIPGLPLRDFLYMQSYSKSRDVFIAVEYMFYCSALSEPGPEHCAYTQSLGIGKNSFRVLAFIAGVRTLVDFFGSSRDADVRRFSVLAKESALPALRSLVSVS